MLRRAVFLLGLAMTAVAGHALAQLPAAEVVQGEKLFGACAACHSLVPGRNLTGPSLAGIWGRRAGSLQSFGRYSPALKSSHVMWDEKTLDQWLASPAAFIPGNRMNFAGMPNAPQRAALIAFLKAAGIGRVQLPAAMTRAPFKDLKKLGPAHQVTAMRYCCDTYAVTTADGRTTDFWEANLRFKTDSSDTGPSSGKPVIMPAGMMGDRASVFFAAPASSAPSSNSNAERNTTMANPKLAKKPPHRISRRAMLLGAVGATGGVAVIGGAAGVFSSHAEPAGSRGQVTLYKNPQCDCCEAYASYLGDKGFAVKVVPSNDLTMMGENYGIPATQDPCHISLIAGYVVGGHIPIEPINRLLAEKPKIVGINLPGMPTGMPGMPGPKPGPVQIYEIVKGRPPKVFATV